MSKSPYCNSDESKQAQLSRRGGHHQHQSFFQLIILCRVDSTLLKSPNTPIQMDLYMIGQVQGTTGNPSPSSSSNELETLP